MKARFNIIYETHRHAIYGYLFYMTHDEEVAKDLSQETFDGKNILEQLGNKTAALICLLSLNQNKYLSAIQPLAHQEKYWFRCAWQSIFTCR